MILHTLRRLRRSPGPALGVLLFAAILSATMCSLQKANDWELAQYQETYHAIPVHFSVTNLSGTKSTGLAITEDFVELFTKSSGLQKYVSDLQRTCTHPISGDYSAYLLNGITSTALSPELWPENGTYITWFEGYDEDVFSGNEPVCLVPEDLELPGDEGTGEVFLELEFVNAQAVPAAKDSRKLLVVGTFTGGGLNIYCPYTVCQQIFSELTEPLVAQSIRATLANNDDLEELKIISSQWFVEPNPLGTPTPWGVRGYSDYPYALNIDDEMLQRAAETMENSLIVNRGCSLLVLLLSVAVGVLIGYLMIRSRKKEIALMRTLGTSTFSIYFGFALEQMICYGLGIAIGGAVNFWNPLNRLGILAAIYFVGLSTSLLTMLRRNLLASMKEDE